MVRTVKVKMDIGSALEFLQSLRRGTVKNDSLDVIADVLEDTLDREVFVDNLNNVYEIDDVDEMRRLIKSGGIPKLGSYEYYYLRDKKALGLPPHVLTGSMKEGTGVRRVGDETQIFISSDASTKSRQYEMTTYEETTDSEGRTKYTFGKANRTQMVNFGPIHERKKSIIKSAFVLGWKNIMKGIFDVYKNEAMRFRK